MRPRMLGMAMIKVEAVRGGSHRVDSDRVGMRVREMAQEAATLKALHPEAATVPAHRADLPGSDSCGIGSQTPRESAPGGSQDRQERPVGATRFRVLKTAARGLDGICRR
jgi:hypothetical protein